jgi:NitT/TauT family transport system ATP-binding protein
MTAAEPDIVLTLSGVHTSYGSNHVLHDVDLEIARGQIVGLVGPSGSGKTTLLRAILGTRPPDRGRVLMNGVAVRGPGRDRGIVYQRYTLYPFLTAVQNVAFGLMLDGTSPLDRLRFWSWRPQRRRHLEQAAALLESVGLGAALDRYPSEMSGGMCQRVAIAQALILKPEILLLDEPFGALDEATRESLQLMLLEFYQENRRARDEGRKPPYTIMIVTHELNEAIYVSDRVLGLSQHWRWEDAGHATRPGATIVYDKPAPVYTPARPRDYELNEAQRQEIRRIVMEPDDRPHPNDHVVFWAQRESTPS